MKKLILVIILLSVLFLSACNGADVSKTINQTNKSCNDIATCVTDAPQVLAGLCEAVGGVHDVNGNCQEQK